MGYCTIGYILGYGLVAYLIFFKTKLVTNIILPIAFAAVAVGRSLFTYTFTYWNSYFFKSYSGVKLNFDEVISYKAAEEDIDELKYYLKRTRPMFKNGQDCYDKLYEVIGQYK